MAGELIMATLSQLQKLGEGLKRISADISERVQVLERTGAQKNLIEKITVNGTPMNIGANKTVDIPVPTKLTQLENDAHYQENVIEHVQVNGMTLPTGEGKRVHISIPTRVSEFINDAGYQANAVEGVKVNGEPLTADEAKTVDILVPTKVSQVENDQGYQTQSEVNAMIQAAANGSAQITDIVIPSTGWTQAPVSDESTELRYTIDVNVEGATEIVYPSVALHKTDLETASAAGLCPAVQASAGTLRFWAQLPPKKDLAATVLLMTPGNMVGVVSSGGYVLPVATATRLGGVKIGSGITASVDGTITASAGISSEEVVSGTDIEKMLDEIFPTDI